MQIYRIIREIISQQRRRVRRFMAILNLVRVLLRGPRRMHRASALRARGTLPALLIVAQRRSASVAALPPGPLRWHVVPYLVGDHHSPLWR